MARVGDVRRMIRVLFLSLSVAERDDEGTAS